MRLDTFLIMNRLLLLRGGYRKNKMLIKISLDNFMLMILHLIVFIHHRKIAIFLLKFRLVTAGAMDMMEKEIFRDALVVLSKD